MRKRQVVGVFALGFAVLAIPGAVRADEPAGTAPDPAARRAVRMIGEIEVQIDPQTGRLVQPTPEKARELAGYLIRKLDRSAPGHQLVRRPDGTVSVDLHDLFQSVMIATVGEGQRVTPHCVTDAKSAEALLEAATNGVDAITTSAPATLDPAPSAPTRRVVEK